MGLFTADRARRDGRVTIVQLVTAVAGFLVFSIVGGVLVAGLALPAITVAGQAVNGSVTIFESLPEEFSETDLPQASNIYASDGTTLLATFYTQNRISVTLEEISPWMQKAQVAIEDKRFWDHHGVDGDGLARAAYLAFTEDATQGASTITQQFVKNTLIQAAEAESDPVLQKEAFEAATETTITRKVREWRIALAYEEKLNSIYGDTCSEEPKVDCGKEKVLEQYLNIAQYGPRVYGVEAAAYLYFGIPSKELNLIQAATIAGITQNPTKWDPLRNPDQAEYRRNLVLGVMYDEGQITEGEYLLAKFTPIEVTLHPSIPKASCAASDLAPFFCDYVTKVIRFDEAFNGEGKKLLYQGGLKIVTTLDATMQAQAMAAVTAGVPAADPSGLEDSLVALDVGTGNILTMAQNRAFDPSSEEPYSTAINYSVDREYGGSRGFSPGSSFKSLVLAEWLDTGRSLNQVVSGAERKWAGNSWKASCPGTGGYSEWSPGNVEASENRQTSVTNATAYSINTAYAAMSHQLDLCEIRDMALALGFHRADGLEFEVVPSVTLGSQNASPLTMASSYQTFANRGVHCEPRAILSITTLDGEPALDSEGNVIEPPPVECSQVIRPEVADGVTFALTKVMEYGTAKKSTIGRPAAGKTGTAQNNTHLWFIGYTPQIVSAVWVGNAETDVHIQRTAIGPYKYQKFWYGGDIAAPIWANFMKQATANMPVLPLPTASDQMLNGAQLTVPDVKGKTEKEANDLINDAGFLSEASPEVIFDASVPPGTIIRQSPEAGSLLKAGSKVTYYRATDALPGWWYNWPDGWDRNVPPSDWWGGTANWPPAEFATNPPIGWVVAPPPNPDPGPGVGTPGGGTGSGKTP